MNIQVTVTLIDDHMNQVVQKIQQVTCQVYNNTKVIGSGIFIKINQNHYLVSAAHVLSFKQAPFMRFPNGEELIKILGDWKVTEIPVTGSVEDDKIDVTIIRLNGESIKEVLKRFSFLPIEKIEINHKNACSFSYFLFGYPNYWTSIKPIDSNYAILKPRPFFSRVRINANQAKEIPEYDHGSKILIEFNLQKLISTDKLSCPYLPNFKGMSGSGLWDLSINDKVNTEDQYKLVGILTDYFKGESNIIAVTPICIITEVIRQKFDPMIEQSTLVKINIE
jgi:hypothetical protein